MSWYIVKLTFLSPLHIGDDEAGIGVENVQSIIHSDTIFSALVNAASLIDEASVQFLLGGNFCISSAFPYDENHYYLPRPLFPLPTSFGKYANEVKKCEFLQEEDFCSWINGQLNENNIGSVIFRSHKVEETLSIDIRPRNASDRRTSNTLIYHCSGTVFNQNCGLYFILQTDADGKQKIEQILEVLQKLGLGGERSSGYGRFEAEIFGPVDNESRWRNIKTNQGALFCILSLYHPGNEGEKINTISYQTLLRKGWIFSNISAKQMKRKTVRMFKEGSVFETEPAGGLVDVTPNGFTDHKVYRWGKALAVRINIR